MSQHIVSLFIILCGILTTLLCLAGGLYLRRLWVVREQRRHALHVRLLRSELMQALARDETAFMIGHWTIRDRKAAFEVSAQLLGFIKGRDRQKLQAIIEANGILHRTLIPINRLSKRKRIAAVRALAAFGNQSVQGTLEHLMLNDPSNEVRLEAAIAITVAGKLPAPWGVIRSVCKNMQTPTPNHYRLFEQMMPETCDAMIALATLQEDPLIRLLATHALGFADPKRALMTLKMLSADTDPHVALKAAGSLEKIVWAAPACEQKQSSSVIYMADKRAA